MNYFVCFLSYRSAINISTVYHFQGPLHHKYTFPCYFSCCLCSFSSRLIFTQGLEIIFLSIILCVLNHNCQNNCTKFKRRSLSIAKSFKYSINQASRNIFMKFHECSFLVFSVFLHIFGVTERIRFCDTELVDC